jgi:hypothetical protein
MENIFDILLEEILDEKLVKVRHQRVKVKHQSGAARSKAKRFRTKNKLKIKLRAKKRKLKLRSKPKARPGYSWNSKGKLIRKQTRIGVRKKH